MATRGGCGRRAVGIAAVVTAGVVVEGPSRLFSAAPWAGQQWRPSTAAVTAVDAKWASAAAGGGAPSAAASGWGLLAGAAAATLCAAQVQRSTTRHAAKAVREWEKKKAGYKPDPEAEAAEAAEKEKEEIPEPPFQPSEQLGVTEPLGYFDPLNFCPPGDKANFRSLRAAEIKHGRVAMMASAGAVVQHFIRIPGFEDAPSGFTAAWGDPSIWGMFALFFISGLVEIAIWTEPEDLRFEPGDFGDPLGLAQLDKETRNKELNNGRLAMFTTLGIIAAELLTKKDAIEQFGLKI